MFILKKGHQPGVYVPLRALFLVYPTLPYPTPPTLPLLTHIPPTLSDPTPPHSPTPPHPTPPHPSAPPHPYPLPYPCPSTLPHPFPPSYPTPPHPYPTLSYQALPLPYPLRIQTYGQLQDNMDQKCFLGIKFSTFLNQCLCTTII